jgi:cation diffusion facilitator family transporter
MSSIEKGLRATLLGIGVNFALAVIKITTGVLGNCYALIADGIESTADIFSSFVTYTGLRISDAPPDDCHPYGHGKAESLAGMVVGLGLLVAAGVIVYQSIREIMTPHHAPAWYTLVVLALVIIIKFSLSRFALKTGEEIDSIAVKGDAWHHYSDAVTSAAAFVGISIALIGGDGYEPADDWAALFACVIIVFNGVRIFRAALHEVMDGAVDPEIVEDLRLVAVGVEGVHDIEKLRVRKSGIGLLMDIHVHVDGNLSVSRGHEIGGTVKSTLMRGDPRVRDVVIHIEPAE